MSTESELEAIARTVEAHGDDATDLHDLSHELARMHEPSPAHKAWHTRTLDRARAQFAHALGELGESATAIKIITRAVRNPGAVSAAEKDAVRAQLLDVFRMVPASALAAANAALPIPGTSLATPWLLIKLGLMPSRWRESYILDRLQKESDRLRTMGLDGQAARLDALTDEVREEIEARDVCDREANLLRFWDANGDNAWDDDERAAYERALASVREAVLAHGHRKQWFALRGAHVVGPFVLSTGGDPRDLHGLPDEGLLCFKGTSGWVCVHDLRRVLPDSAPETAV